MLKILSLAAFALVLAGPAMAVDLGIDAASDIQVTTPDVSVGNTKTKAVHSSTVVAPEGTSTIHTEEEVVKSSSHHKAAIGADADMTVDDEE